MSEDLSHLSDEELKALGREMGVEISLPSDLESEPLPPVSPEEAAAAIDHGDPREGREGDEVPPEPPSGPRRVPGPNDDLIAAGEPPRETLEQLLLRAKLDPFGGFTEEEEQRVRDHYGYTASERRTIAERQGTADRILAKADADGYQGDLPAEVQQIWCNTSKDERTARTLIASWGMETFLTSAIHQQALMQAGREEKMAPVRKAFVEVQKRKASKKRTRASAPSTRRAWSPCTSGRGVWPRTRTRPCSRSRLRVT